MADKFQVGDRVFAKIKGWPPWPAKVTGRAEGKVESYHCQFYGTYDQSTVKPEQIFLYNDENKAKYGKPKNNSRWKEAMEEIENNTLLGTLGPIEDGNEEAKTAGADPDTDGDGELMIDEGPEPPVLTKEVSNAKLAAQIQSGKPEPPKGRRGSKASLSKRDSISSASSSTAAEGSTTPSTSTAPTTEMVSRSGRKIKPKRFADEEVPATPSKTKASAANLDESGEPPSKRVKRGGRTPPVTKATPISAEPKEPIRARMVIGKGRGAPVKPISSGRLSPDISAPVTVSVPRAPALRPAAVALHNQRKIESTPSISSPVPKKPLPALIPASGAVASSLTPTGTLGPVKRVAPLKEEVKEEQLDEESEDEIPPILAINTEEAETDDKENLKDSTASSNGSEIESESDMEKNSEIDETMSRYSEAYDENLSKIPFVDKEGESYELRFEDKEKEDFETEDERAEYETSINLVFKVKEELEQGDQESHEIIQDLLEANKDEFDPEEAAIRERRATQIRTLRIEGEVIEIIGEIISCLSERQADCMRALELLERLGTHELTPLILKKHPEVVNTIGRLRNYVGNNDQWQMIAEQYEEFQEGATAIRIKAAEIYSSFYSIFIPLEERIETVTFEEIFQEEMKVFQEMTKSYSMDEILGLTAEAEGGFEMYEMA